MPLMTTFLLSFFSSELFLPIPIRVSLQHPKAFLAHRFKVLHILQKTINKTQEQPS